MKAEHDWHAHIHQKTVCWREWGSNCCSAPSLTACAKRHRLQRGSYLRLLRLILLEIPINSHKAAPQGCQMPTAFSDSGGCTFGLGASSQGFLSQERHCGTWNKSNLILLPGLYDSLMSWLKTHQNWRVSTLSISGIAHDRDWLSSGLCIMG